MEQDDKHGRCSSMPFGIAVDANEEIDPIEEDMESPCNEVEDMLEDLLELVNSKQEKWRKLSAFLKERYSCHMK